MLWEETVQAITHSQEVKCSNIEEKKAKVLTRSSCQRGLRDHCE